MKSLTVAATNPFPKALENCSYDNGVKFIDGTIGRVEKNNPEGVYTPLLTQLKANAVIYKSATTVLQKGDQKSATETVNATIDTIVTTGLKLYNEVENVWGLKTPKLMEFFPSGKTQLHRLNRGSIPILIQIWNDKAGFYSEDLGDEWVTKLSDLKTNWENVSGFQTGKKGAVDTSRKNAGSITETIGQNLWDLFLLIQQKNQPHAENVIDSYFDITPLKHKVHSDHDGLGRVSGNMQDVNNQIIKNVNVIITDGDGQNIWIGKTNPEGNWRTPNLPIGMYHITFKKDTYVSQVVSHEIVDDIDTVVNIVLVAE